MVAESILNVTTDSEGFFLCDLQLPTGTLKQVLLTEGMVDATVGQLFGVFGSTWDARQSDADDFCLGIVSKLLLTEELIEIARSNSAIL